MPKITIPLLKEMKERQEKITMLTAYDFPQALMVDEAGIEVVLVGDSLGMVVLGYEDTLKVTTEDVIYHSRAVSRALKNALLVADMPFLSYQVSKKEAIYNAGRLIQEGGAQAVKVEGGGAMIKRVKAIVEAGIAVMGHLGLTPQMVNQFGGFKVQGKKEEQAKKIIDDALALEDAGAFSLVLECVPADLAKEITSRLQIPVIGIGAGPYCDGQVLVFHDLLGLFPRLTPKFVRRYAELYPEILKALQDYKQEVKEGLFPTQEHSF